MSEKIPPKFFNKPKETNRSSEEVKLETELKSIRDEAEEIIQDTENQMVIEDLATRPPKKPH